MFSVSVISTSADGQADELAKAMGARGSAVRLRDLRGLGTHEVGRAAGQLVADRELERAEVATSYGRLAGLTTLVAKRQEGVDVPVVHRFDGLGTTRRRYLGRAAGVGDERLRLDRAICRAADRLLARSDVEATDLCRLGAARSRISVVPGGVDLETYTPTGPALDEKGAPHRLVSIAPIGRFERHGGIDATILALQGFSDVELEIAGGPDAGGLDADPECVRLRRLARRTGVADRVHFRGVLAREEIPQLLRSADVAVNVPAYLPYGTVTLEAMACGRPVIATPVTGQCDSVIEGMTGIFVPPGRPDALAKAIRELLTDSIRLDGFGLAARERAETRHAWSRIANETEAALHQAQRESSSYFADAG